MLDKLKNFFAKKKLARKFADVPSGHVLGSAPTAVASVTNISAITSSSSSSTTTSAASSVKNVQARNAAAEAAARRAAQHSEKNSALKIPRSYLPPPEKEPESIEQAAEMSEEKVNEDDLYKFNCPELEINEYYPLPELKNRMVDQIKTHFGEDPVICGSMLIRNCNPRGLRDVCISTLEAILNNLQIDDQEKLAKFKRIRKTKIENKILSVKGGMEFFNGIGFTLSPEDEEWFVFNDPAEDLVESCQYYLDVLMSCQTFQIKLDREARFYDLNDLNTPNVDFDDKVFEYSRDELAREQKTRKEVADRELTLMTQAMRDKFLNKRTATRYTRLRYKRLDLKMIEATFRTNEKLVDLIKWLREDYSMGDIETYDIVCGTKIIPKEEWEKTFSELGLYPKVTFYQRLIPTGV